MVVLETSSPTAFLAFSIRSPTLACYLFLLIQTTADAEHDGSRCQFRDGNTLPVVEIVFLRSAGTFGFAGVALPFFWAQKAELGYCDADLGLVYAFPSPYIPSCEPIESPQFYITLPAAHSRRKHRKCNRPARTSPLSTQSVSLTLYQPALPSRKHNR